MNAVLSATIGVMIATASCAGTPKGAILMSSSEAGAAQDGRQAFSVRPLPVREAEMIDGLKLVEARGHVTLLYSTQERSEGRYELVIRALPIAEPARATEVARVERLLPAPPRWDARLAGDRYEIVYEMAGGAINAILFQDVEGNTKRVSVEHPFESFTRPHFVDGSSGLGTRDIGAVADLKKIVVFPGGATHPVKYVSLAEGTDGIVGGTGDRWVAAKNVLSGPAMFDTLPGRLALWRSGGPDIRSSTVPDLLVYELAAASVDDDVVVFATGKPALLIAGRRPERPYQLTAETRTWLLQLARPAILITPEHVHLAAIANLRTNAAVVLYGSMPRTVLRQ